MATRPRVLECWDISTDPYARVGTRSTIEPGRSSGKIARVGNQYASGDAINNSFHRSGSKLFVCNEVFARLVVRFRAYILYRIRLLYFASRHGHWDKAYFNVMYCHAFSPLSFTLNTSAPNRLRSTRFSIKLSIKKKKDVRLIARVFIVMNAVSSEIKFGHFYLSRFALKESTKIFRANGFYARNQMRR